MELLGWAWVSLFGTWGFTEEKPSFFVFPGVWLTRAGGRAPLISWVPFLFFRGVFSLSPELLYIPSFFQFSPFGRTFSFFSLKGVVPPGGRNRGEFGAHYTTYTRGGNPVGGGKQLRGGKHLNKGWRRPQKRLCEE